MTARTQDNNYFVHYLQYACCQYHVVRIVVKSLWHRSNMVTKLYTRRYLLLSSLNWQAWRCEAFCGSICERSTDDEPTNARDQRLEDEPFDLN